MIIRTGEKVYQNKPSSYWKNAEQQVEQPLYTAAEIKSIEQQAARTGGYPMYQLMEKAGLACWQYLQQHWQEARKITIICGKGNNAGDGFVLARIAVDAGKVVQLLTVEAEAEYKGDALIAYQAMIDQGIQPQVFSKQLLADQDLIVDAILGTGLKGVLRENYLQVIEAINHSMKIDWAPVLSIDIPSGLESDTGFANPVAINATITLTFIALKSGMVTSFARAYCGSIHLEQLGIDDELFQQFSPVAWIDSTNKLIHNLPKRSEVSHKGDHGHLLLLGGDYGFGGAILMSAIAAARCGVGMLTILTRDAHVAPILSQCPEAMIRSVSGADDPVLKKLLDSVDAVVIGPGLGQEDWGVGLLKIICKTELPILIDADALNILARHQCQNTHWVMTPHPGEAGRLLDQPTSQIQQDRYLAAKELQKKYSGVVVLKGAGSLIIDQQQRITVCNEGNPGMATAGMGDILSGIIGSLLAQGIESHLAARTGVALHARAGDLAAEKGQKGLMATDLIEPLRLLVNQ
ncbi:MAG: NAD(P)H-hydrate dehydratase [Gammaproteobacteria bacterium]|nr:NAD(P)H-hydrate dehydratase [Gammaproteobacteria bacterium]